MNKRNENSMVNSSAVRAGALVNFTLLSLALLASIYHYKLIAGALLFYQVVSFFNTAWRRPLFTSRLLNNKLSNIFGAGVTEHPLPVKFASKIGFILTLIAFLSIGITSISILFVSLCLVASALNAFTGLCIACKIYPRFTLLKTRLYRLIRE